MNTRSLVLTLLHSLHIHNNPHIIMGMRPQDPLPDWTTHLALIRKDGTVHTGKKDDVLDAASHESLHQGWTPPAESSRAAKEGADIVVSLSGVSVSYGKRKVSTTSFPHPIIAHS